MARAPRFQFSVTQGHHRLTHAYDDNVPVPVERMDTRGNTSAVYADPRKLYESPEIHKPDAAPALYEHGWTPHPASMQKAWELYEAPEKRHHNESGIGWDPSMPPEQAEPIREAIELTPTERFAVPYAQQWAENSNDVTLSDWKWEGPLPEGTLPLSEVQFVSTRARRDTGQNSY